MADNTFEHIKGTNAEWDAPVYEVEDENSGDSFSVIGWNGLDFDNPDSYRIYEAEAKTENGTEAKYVAFPAKVADSLQLDEGRVTPRQIWRKFLNYGDDWTRVVPFVPEIERRDVNIEEEIRENARYYKTEKLGQHSLDLGVQVFGKSSRSSIGPILYSYDDFFDRIIDTVRDEATCYINIQNGDIYKEKENKDGRPSSYKVEFNNLRIDKIDVKAEWTKPYDSQKVLKKNIAHSLRGDVVISYYEQGVWKPIKTRTDMRLADIPAINEGNGLFKKSGSLYAIPCETMDNGKKLKTPGMKLYEALKVGVYDFCAGLGRQMIGFNMSNSYAADKLLKKLNMNSGFDELFRGASSDNEEENEEEKILAALDNGAEEEKEIAEESAEAEAAEKDKDNPFTFEFSKEEAEPRKKGKFKVAEKPYARLSGSALYATDNNIIPRDALTVKISASLPYITGEVDDKKTKANGGELVYKTMRDENNPTLSTCYFLDPSSSPEGKNASLRGRLISHLRIGFDGTIYKAVVTPDQLKETEKITLDTIKWMPVFAGDGKSGKECLENCYYVRAGDMNEDGTFRLNEKGHIMAQKGANTYLISPDAENVYISIDPKCDHTTGVDLTGIPNMSKENRTQIKNSQTKAATITTRAQTPSLTGNKEPAIGQDLVYYAEDDGIVEKIEYGLNPVLENVPVNMTVRYDSGNVQNIDLRAWSKNNSKNLREFCPSAGIKEGTKVKKGQALTDSGGVCQGEACIGTSAIIGMGGGAAEFGTDDCILISARLASVLGLPMTDTQEAEIITNESGSGHGPHFTYNPIIGKDVKYFGGYDCSKLGPDGIIRDGETVNAGDLIAWVMAPNGKVRRTLGEQLAMEHPKENEPFTAPEDYKPEPIFAKEKIHNAKVKTSIENAGAGEGRKKLKIEYASSNPAESGCKISIDGMKGEIIVMEKGKEPVVLDKRSKLYGMPIDILFSGNSAQNRQTPGIILLALINRLAFEKGIILNTGIDSRNIVTDFQNRSIEEGFGDMTTPVYYKDKVYNMTVGVAQQVINIGDKQVSLVSSTKAKTRSFMGITTGNAIGLEATQKELAEKGIKQVTLEDPKTRSMFEASGYGVNITRTPEELKKYDNQYIRNRNWNIRPREHAKTLTD